MKHSLLFGVLILTTVATILTGCFQDLIPQEAPGRAKRLAKLNRLDAADVSVQVSAFKANYLTSEFKKIPPDGVIRINSAVNYRKMRQPPLFLSFVIPGGDVTQLLSHPDVCGIRKNGNLPVSCGKLPDKAPQHALELKNWTMEDLSALAKAVPLDSHRRIIDLEPKNGLADWNVIAAFPSSFSWRFRNVREWRNPVASVSADALVFLDNSKVVLPERLKCFDIFIEKTCEVPENTAAYLKQAKKQKSWDGGQCIIYSFR